MAKGKYWVAEPKKLCWNVNLNNVGRLLKSLVTEKNSRAGSPTVSKLLRIGEAMRKLKDSTIRKPKRFKARNYYVFKL